MPLYNPADISTPILRLNSWTKFRQKSEEFSSLLFIVTSPALSWDFYFFKLTQPLTVSTVQLMNTVKEKGGKPGRKPYPLPYGIRNPYGNLKSENSQDYAQKPRRDYMFMNSASYIPPPLHCSYFPEPVFVDLLRRPGIDSQPGGPVRNSICRTGPPSYIGWRNRFLGFDSWAP